MTQTKYLGQVLILDDDPHLRGLLELELESAGYRVSTASNISELKSRAKERSYQFVILDLFVGDENGLEAIPFIIKECPKARIVVMSASGTIEWAVNAMEKGATTFLSKTKDPRELAALLKEQFRSDAHLEHTGRNKFGIVGDSSAINDVIDSIEKYLDVDSTVLIQGESGTGKELVARAIHFGGPRKNQTFEAVNCGAIPAELLESELFGHVKGAFTDAKGDRKGLFEICTDGTLFLDEIGEMPIELQVKLLRVLQEGEVMPLGSSRTVKVNTRVVAATNKDLKQRVAEKKFREDLYYRLAILRVSVPPLRERKEDIPPLVEHFVAHYSKRFGKTIAPISNEVMSRLMLHQWPGNVRELQNSIERGVVLAQGANAKLRLEDVLQDMGGEDHVMDDANHAYPMYYDRPLSEAKKGFEKSYLEHLLEVTKGNISEMARISGRYRADVYRLLSKYGVEWEEFRP